MILTLAHPLARPAVILIAQKQAVNSYPAGAAAGTAESGTGRPDAGSRPDSDVPIAIFAGFLP